MAVGLGSMYNFLPSKKELRSRPSSIRAALIYTQKKQSIIEFGHDLYLGGEDYHLIGNINFTNFSDRFYGIGNNTSEDMEENFRSRITRISINFQKRVIASFNIGILYEFEHNKIIEVEKDGQLAKGEILGSGGGTASGIGLLMNRDTRNDIFFPSSGDFWQLSTSMFMSGLGSSYDFTRYSLDLRKYFPLFSSHVLAFQSMLNIITGDPPFQMLSLMGGQNWMRGFYRGRFRDKNMIIFQIEYRVPLWWRLGLVTFLAFGDVADKADNFVPRNFKYSGGWEFRYLLSRKEKINVRFDFGFSKESFGVYIAVSEAF